MNLVERTVCECYHIIRNEIDRAQTEWLRRVSRDPRPKILVTGKPIYTGNVYKPSRLEDGGSSAEDAEADGVCLCNCSKDAAYWKDFVQTTLTTGMRMAGKMSVGVFTTASTPNSTIKIARTTNV